MFAAIVTQIELLIVSRQVQGRSPRRLAARRSRRRAHPGFRKHAELSGAATRDDLQDVGRRSREILIDCVKLLADPSLVSAAQVPPKAGDAKAWLDLFLVVYAHGRHRDDLRRFIRSAWDLSQTVTHGDIDRVEAFAAAQATVLVVRTLQGARGGEQGGGAAAVEPATGGVAAR